MRQLFTGNENSSAWKTKENILMLLSNCAICGNYWLETKLCQNYGACGPFTKYHERVQKFRETDNLKHLHRIELDKACFAHDAAYSDSKDLAMRTISDKTLKQSLWNC